MKKVIFTVIMMLMSAGCLSADAISNTSPTPEPVRVDTQWQNDSHQYWGVNPMSMANTTVIMFNQTGDVNITLNLTAFFHEPLAWEQGFVNYTITYQNESWSVVENMSQTNHTYNISNVSGNMTIEIKSNGSDNPLDNYPGDYFIAETYIEMWNKE
tara:strand:+ start:359 stop:826 length:468 start_codon:yes stop_codon:yes gene_type:complete